MGTDRTLLVLAVVVVVALAGCAGGIGGDGADAGGSTAADGDPGGSGGSDGADASTDWCPEGTTQNFANPETGEQTSMEVRGMVERDGRQVCQAVWETNANEEAGDVQKIEMYYTEDREYYEMVMYDGDGNVVEEFDMSRSSD